ncbi:phosphoribosylanthranilate isomerase [Fulvivirga sp. M361]|uniref:phosphoribosylanthranilate isomerase n=1 Tax=Fulvivirga sp. M361 TaxID=2594266 RepID=UPI001C871640|nr:phosphoribosylanthranilate isomerase [Fulvivirga sp. M361]
MSNEADIRLKVCGLRDNIQEVIALAPDFVGFIFYPESPRYVGALEVGKIASMPESIKKIGVFVNEELPKVREIIHKYSLDLVQLHGHETVEYCKDLKTDGIGVIKVFSGNDLPSQELLQAYVPYIDYYLFDTRSENYGGTGQKFNWSQLEVLDLERPFFLSGGVDMDSIDHLKKGTLSVYAIDVNSKFEMAPGLKDIKLLEQLKLKMN